MQEEVEGLEEGVRCRLQEGALSLLSWFLQGLDPLGASSLESHWGTPSKPPSCQVSQKEASRGTEGPVWGRGVLRRAQVSEGV